MLFAKRLIRIKTNISHTLTRFCYQFMYLISLSNAVNLLHSLFVLEVCFKLYLFICAVLEGTLTWKCLGMIRDPIHCLLLPLDYVDGPNNGAITCCHLYSYIDIYNRYNIYRIYIIFQITLRQIQYSNRRIHKCLPP